MTPALSLLMHLDVRVGPPVTVDPGPPGRRFVPIIGGDVTGAFQGKVLPGGGDWQTILADGRLEISAHYVLDIEGHGAVEIRSDGVRHGPPEVLAALGRGEAVDPSSYYFRTAIRLATSAPGLARLNAVLAVSVGAHAATGVSLDIYEVS